MNSFDLVIVGSGPAGLSCAIAAQDAKLNYIVVDKGSIVDSIQRFQRNMYFFSTPELLEIGGIPFVVPTMRPTSLDCVNYYRRVADLFALNLKLFARVNAVTRQTDAFEIRLSTNEIMTAKAVVLATGYYDSPNRLEVLGENLPHVSHFYTDPLPFFRQRVLIVGGKNSAVEAALDLYRHGARVTLVHRGVSPSSGVKYWLLPDFENRVKDGAITAFFQSHVNEFRPKSTVVMDSSGTKTEIPTDFAFVLVGYHPDVEFFRSCSIEVDSESLAPKFAPDTMETSVPGLFIAGGIAGGRFTNKVFIENGREHGKMIIRRVVQIIGQRVGN